MGSSVWLGLEQHGMGSVCSDSAAGKERVVLLRHFQLLRRGGRALPEAFSAVGSGPAEDAHAAPRAVGSSPRRNGAAEATKERRQWQGMDGAVIPFVMKSINQWSHTPFGISSCLQFQPGGRQHRELVSLQ